MLAVEDARSRILSTIDSLGAEHVLLPDAARRVLSNDLVAPVSLPLFDNSAMDGYAVRANDVQAASTEAPVTLKLKGAIAAGATAGSFIVDPGTCIRVFTGSPLPAGADAIVMQEDTRVLAESVQVLDSVTPWENVRLTGEDVRANTPVLRAGERITAATIALLGALGLRGVSVGRRPAVGIVNTGSELAESPPLPPAHVFECNRHAIATLVADAGGVPRVYPLVRDTIEETKAALITAFAECDCVVTTGGVSVGEHDVVKPALADLGGTVEFWRVAMKPGKPFVFGSLGQKKLFGLPGNPVSAFVSCILLVVPAIRKWQGATNVMPETHPATLGDAVSNHGDRLHYMRVSVDAAGIVRSTGVQASHTLNSLANANALLPVPPNTAWSFGRTVQVVRWNS
jgi:molybdopterin molybdotransferase